MLNFFIGFAFFEFGALCGFFVAALMQAARDGGEIAGRNRTKDIQHYDLHHEAVCPGGFTGSCVFCQNLAYSQMVTNVLQLLCIYARKQNEVIVIRRILTCTVSILLLLGAFLLPMRAEAATADSKAGVVTTASGKLNVRSSS